MPASIPSTTRADHPDLCTSAPLRRRAPALPRLLAFSPIRLLAFSLIRSFAFSLTLLLLAAGCGGPTPTMPSFAVDPTLAGINPTSLPIATPTLDVVSPEQIGRAFLDAWRVFDYGRMYGLLTPELRSEMTPEAFAQAYATPIDTTTTVSVTIVPETLNIDNDVAWINLRQIWHTAVFGDLQANNRLNLIRAHDQWWIDWSRGAIWPDLADGRSFRVEYQIPPRANIYDTTGAGLAVPATIVTIGVVPEQIQDEPTLVFILSEITGLTIAEIQSRYAGQPTNWFIPITDVTSEVSLEHDAELRMPGVVRRERTGRFYPMDGVGAHVIGWVSPVPAESYRDYRNRGYRGDETVGISGLEAWGERILAGSNGARLTMVAPDGTYLGKLSERPVERGRALQTTLDRELQYQAEQALGDRRGAVVALDVATGAVRALASGPGFDNNIFVRPTEDWELNAVLYDPNQPLLNRATLGQYPAGSVFKIITISAALGPGGMVAESPFNCPGYWDGFGVNNRKMCWKTDGHGDITLEQGLMGSCNVVFYTAGSRLHAVDPDALSSYGRAFGFGQATGLVGLPEAAGIMPGPEWKFATYNEPWSSADTVHLSIGQGYLAVTPLQVARAVAAVANGGAVLRPYLVEHIDANDQNAAQDFGPLTVGNLPVSAAHLAIIREALLGVTTNTQWGTAWHRFTGLSIPVAGKTGTAETGIAGVATHAWFAGYWPADVPQIAMVVMLENGGEGSTIAAPMFRQIVEGYNGLPITPLPGATPTAEPTE